MQYYQSRNDTYVYHLEKKDQLYYAGERGSNYIWQTPGALFNESYVSARQVDKLARAC